MDTKTNIRSLPPEALPWPLEPFRATTANGPPYLYGGFGYEGVMADKAIAADSPDALRLLHEYGCVDHTTRTFFNTPLRRFCGQLVKVPDGNGEEVEQVRAPKCEALLAELGYPA